MKLTPWIYCLLTGFFVNACTEGAPDAAGDDRETGSTDSGSDALDFSELRGFNLLGLFMQGSEGRDTGYKEDDFRLISELGFNFVRLPVDYRTYTTSDWLTFDESVLGKIDAAVEWGGTWGIHVCLNLHRGPGFTVASPAEETSLWQDEETQAVFKAHWEMFAERYADIPGSRLSFNLINEPAGVPDTVYGQVMRPVIEAIWEHNPHRPIVSDGLDYCARPAESLADLDIVQALRGYHPQQFTHYMASWIEGSDTWPEPTWPPPEPVLATYFYGDDRPELQTSLVIGHDFQDSTTVSVEVHQVSHEFTFEVYADDALIGERSFAPSADDPDASEIVYEEAWDIYQNIYDLALDFPLPDGTTSLEIRPTAGDWMTINNIAVSGSESFTFVPNNTNWGATQVETVIQWDVLVAADPTGIDGAGIIYEYLDPWLAYRDAGGKVFVGEFGTFNQTPHVEVMKWLDELLDIYAEENLGWAMWEFSGAFGPLDSERADVTYETWEDHDADRQMLNLLVEPR
jgi:aryl-phospho-beta-D-glucosidase BglC (GH1 family)